MMATVQGHEMTRTEIAMERANVNGSPRNSQNAPERTAMVMTRGTKIPLTLSAIFPIGALDALAFCTSSMIAASVVSSPTFYERNVKLPSEIVPAEMASPGFLITGMLSPVKADISIGAESSVIVPSTGMPAPGQTTIRSPTTTSLAGTITSTPLRRTVAVFGARSMNFLTASVVFPFDLVSRYLPIVTSERIIAADSK